MEIFSYKIKYIFCFIVLLLPNSLVYSKNNCWINFDAKQHFEVMDELDDRYAKVRKEFQETSGGRKLDKEMLVIFFKTRGIAERALHAAEGNPYLIPAGINLGGYCMMKLPDSLLLSVWMNLFVSSAIRQMISKFFHRMKLRNNTIFRIKDIKNDLANLQVEIRIQLNDLHLFGSYDFTSTNAQPGYLTYEPTFGQIELLLKNVTYNMNGRYRLLRNKLNMEMVLSEIEIDDILMMYRNKNSTLSLKLNSKSIDVFLERLKVDLDKWIKDYFNDYLMYYVVAENSEFEKYNKEKTKILNTYTDKVVNMVIQRINQVKANAVQLPAFTIVNSVDKEIRLRDGVLRGLDSIYRRSIATGTKENNIRKIDTVVAFSNLKLTYTFDAILKSGFPAVTGSFTLTADELSAHMSLSLIKNPETADISFTFLEQTKPESLTIEGPANRMISNFKYLLERHIIAIMVNTLIHNIKMLGSLDRCVPLLPPHSSVHDSYTDDISELENSTNSFEQQTEEPSPNKNIPHSEYKSDTEKPSDELDTDSNKNAVTSNDTDKSQDNYSDIEKKDVLENENRKASKLRHHNSRIPSHETKSNKNQLKHKSGKML